MNYTRKLKIYPPISIYFAIIFSTLILTSYNAIQGFKATDSNQSSSTADSNPLLSNITIETDKKSYGEGDLVNVSGTLDDSVQVKTVRIDVYDPKGKVFSPYNSSFSEGPRENWSDPYPRLSDIQVKINDEGQFSYRFPLDGPVSGGFIKGIYKIEVTYNGVTKNETFTAR